MNTPPRNRHRSVALGATVGLLTAGLLVAAPANAATTVGAEHPPTQTRAADERAEPTLRVLYPEGATEIGTTTEFGGTAHPSADVWIASIYQEGLVVAAGPDGRWSAIINASAGWLGLNIFSNDEWTAWEGLVTNEI